MRKTFLIVGIFLVSLSTTTRTQDTFPTSQPNSQPFSISSSLPPTPTYTPPCHEVSVQTFNLLNEVISVLQYRDQLDLDGKEPHREVNFAQYNLKAIRKELRAVDNCFPAKGSIDERSISAFMKHNRVTVTCKEHKLHLGKDYMDNRPLLKPLITTSKSLMTTIAPVVDKKPISQNSLLSSIVSASLFKASCAATIAGVITYYAVGFYNKNKNQEEQYSQKKWAVGTATVTGITAFAYLYWRAQAVLIPDDLEVIT